MTTAPVSVIVVSRGRPAALVRCLTGVARLDHPPFEVVVVADPAGLAAIAGRFAGAKTTGFDEPNIARARNLGLLRAAGQVVAFIDDDAVPEPTWLSRLVAPLGDPNVAAAGGFVIGRNGISFQWTASVIDALGQRLPLATDGARTTLHRGSAAMGIKTEGTNMAFRRDVLARIGGFDERLAYYLDESDVNLRLGALGVSTAVVPLAQVHHGFAESDRRRGDRVPRSLFDIGASLAVYLAKHGTDPASRYAGECAAQRRRLIGHMVAGRIEPRDVGRLIDSFAKGWEEGLARVAVEAPDLTAPTEPFRPFAAAIRPQRHQMVCGRSWEARRIKARAAEIAATGQTVTAVILSPSTRYHRVTFEAEGYWLHAGGLFGRSLRTDPLVRFWPFAARVSREVARVRPLRDGTVPP